MKNRITVLIVVATILLSAGCNGGRREYRRLVALEQVLEQNPDSVRSVLYSMDIPIDSRSKALYTVLKTQSDYKCYEPLDTDSLMLEATAYYKTNRKNYYAALAYYTLGCVYDEKGNDIAAIDAYLKAKDLFPDTLIRYYALTECLLGLRYKERNIFTHAEKELFCAMENAKRLVDVHTYNISMYNYALCLLHSREFETAEQYFLTIPDNNSYSEYYRANALLQLSKIYHHHHKNYNKSLIYINRYLGLNKTNNEAGLAIKANVFYDMGRYDSAYHYFSESLKTATELNTIALCYEKLTDLSFINSQYYDSTVFAKYKEQMDSLFNVRKLKELNDLRYKHAIEIAENELLHTRRIMLYVFLFLSICTFLFVLLYIVSYKKWKNEKLWHVKDKISQTEALMYSKQLEINEPQDGYNSIRKDILDMFRNLLEECRELFIQSEANTVLISHTAVVRDSYEEAEVKQVTNTILEIFRPVLVFISSKNKSIDNKGFIICVLSYLGYNNVEISLFLNVSAESVRQRVKRIKETFDTELYKCIFMKSLRNNA